MKRSKNCSNGGIWGLPGGLIDRGESTHVAVKRELFEESGIKETMYGIQEQKTFLLQEDDKDINMTVFKATLFTSEQIELDPHEHSAYIWIDINKIPDLNDIMPDVPSMLSQLIQ